MKKRSIIFWGLALSVLLLVSGCATSGVAVKPITDSRDAVAEKLIANWNQYDISFYEYGGQVPGALVLDPKNDNKKLRVGSNWTKITSQQELIAVIQRGKMYKAHTFPMLSSITGPDGTEWGYVVTMMGSVSTSMADANTMDIMPPRDPRPSR